MHNLSVPLITSEKDLLLLWELALSELLQLLALVHVEDHLTLELGHPFGGVCLHRLVESSEVVL